MLTEAASARVRFGSVPSRSAWFPGPSRATAPHQASPRARTANPESSPSRRDRSRVFPDPPKRHFLEELAAKGSGDDSQDQKLRAPRNRRSGEAGSRSARQTTRPPGASGRAWIKGASAPSAVTGREGPTRRVRIGDTRNRRESARRRIGFLADCSNLRSGGKGEKMLAGCNSMCRPPGTRSPRRPLGSARAAAEPQTPPWRAGG